MADLPPFGVLLIWVPIQTMLILEAYIPRPLTPLSPYQQLFFDQALVMGTSHNHRLCGKAVFEGAVDYPRLWEAVTAVLDKAPWSRLRIDLGQRAWVEGTGWNGRLLDHDAPPECDIEGPLWQIALVQLAPRKVVLTVYLHHVLGDAHSFALFWEALHAQFTTGTHRPAPAFSGAVDEGAMRPLHLDRGPQLEDVGLGPIQRLCYRFDKSTYAGIVRHCQSKGLSAMSLFVFVLQRQLHHCTHSLGMPLQVGIALRNRSSASARADFLTAVNFLPLGAGVPQDPKAVERDIRLRFRHQAYPLLAALAAQSGHKLFNVLFSYQKESFAANWGEGLTAQVAFLPTPIDENVLGVHLLEYGDGLLKVQMDFRTDGAAACFWKQALANACRDIAHWVATDSFSEAPTSPEAVLRPALPTVPDFWEGYRRADGSHTALVCGEAVVDFATLRAAVTAQSLQFNTENRLVYLEPVRTVAQIVQVLACWQAGIAVCFGSPDDAPMAIPAGTAYLGTTSGTTGERRKVLIQQSGLAGLMAAWDALYGLADSIHLSVADQRFDVFFGDLLRSIVSGHTLVWATEAERLDPQALLRLLRTQRVTHWEATPSLLRVLGEGWQELPDLRVLICGSEAVSPDFVAFVARNKPRGCRAFNSYGLTEVSIDSAAAEMKVVQGRYVPVGFPLGDQSLEVRNAQGELLPLGAWGELWIRGSCVGIPADPGQAGFGEAAGTRWYQTGDKAMLLPRHGLVVGGRLQDDFIKVNGRRVPAKEITEWLLTAGGIHPARCLEVDGRAVLFVPANADSDAVAAALAENFSRYQQPDLIFPTAHWRLNSNGKLDLKALVAEFRAAVPVPTSWVPGDSAHERRVLQCLQKIGRPYGDRHDSLLWMGWNSIDLLRLANALALEGIHIAAAQLLRQPTIATLLAAEVAAPALPSAEQEIADDEMNDILAILNGGL